MLLVKSYGKKIMKIKKEWLSTKEAIQYLKDNEIDITPNGLRYIGKLYDGRRRIGYYFEYHITLLQIYIGKVRDKPADHMIKISELAKELNVHVCRIYRKLKEYQPTFIFYMGKTYVNRPQFIKKYKEEYNGNTDRRKEARN